MFSLMEIEDIAQISIIFIVLLVYMTALMGTVFVGL